MGRLPWGLLGMICLIITVEGALARFVRHSDLVANDWRHAARAAAGQEATHAEILCFGDSQSKLGLQPKVFEIRLNRSTYNLAVLAGPAATSNALLRRVFGAGGQPRLIILNHMPLLLKANPDRYLDQWSALLSFREMVQLACVERKPYLVTQLCLRRALPSLRGRHAIRNYILATARGERFAITEEVRVQRKNALENRGSLLVNKANGSVSETVQLDEKPEPWQFAFANAASLYYVDKFLAVTAARGTPVVWVLPPCGHEWQAYRDHYGLDDGYDRVLHKLQKKYANLSVIDCRHSHYPDVFSDSTHLDRLGAVSLSADLAGLVDRLLLDHPLEAHWWKLPDFQPSSLGDGLEDLEGSRLGLRNKDTSRQ